MSELTVRVFTRRKDAAARSEYARVRRARGGDGDSTSCTTRALLHAIFHNRTIGSTNKVVNVHRFG